MAKDTERTQTERGGNQGTDLKWVLGAFHYWRRRAGMEKGGESFQSKIKFFGKRAADLTAALIPIRVSILVNNIRDDDQTLRNTARHLRGIAIRLFRDSTTDADRLFAVAREEAHYLWVISELEADGQTFTTREHSLFADLMAKVPTIHREAVRSGWYPRTTKGAV